MLRDGKVMNSSTVRVFVTSLAVLVIWCGCVTGQTASNQATGDSSNNAPVGAASNPAPSARADDTFIIGDDDVLAINVWKEPDLTKQIPVRSDGKISLPLVGDILAAGKTPAQLKQDIADRLKTYITDPQVVVIVQEIHSLKFNILGQVAKPGTYPLTTGTTVIDAIAAAGGFRDFAKKKGVYVLRQGISGNEVRYEFNYQAFIKGKNTRQNIVLKPHDTVVVP
jgi:polysaccharide biosynthesis/export protein